MMWLLALASTSALANANGLSTIIYHIVLKPSHSSSKFILDTASEWVLEVTLWSD